MTKEKEHKYYPSMFKGNKKRPSGIGRVATLDTEAVGLLPDMRDNDPTSQHIIVVKDKESKETFVFFDPYDKRDPEYRVWLDEWEGEQDGFLADGMKFLNELDVLICQNWHGYDGHALKIVHGDLFKVDYKAKPRNNGGKRTKQYPFRVMDTLVMSQLLNPERRAPKEAYSIGKGNVAPHSIEAHGIRIGRYKPENEDWTRLTDHMVHRCWEDTAIGEDLFDYLWEEWEEQSAPHPISGLTIEDAYRMEAVMYHEMSLQEQRGFRLDVDFAWKLVRQLDKDKAKIMKDAMPFMPLKLVKSPIKLQTQLNAIDKAFCLSVKQKEKMKKWLTKSKQTHCSNRATNWNFITGTRNYSANTKKDYPDAVGSIDDYKRNRRVVAGPYTPVTFTEITLGNRDIVRQTLYQYGWRGVNMTKGEGEYLEEHEELPYYYAGKLDEASITLWEQTGQPPTWATQILKYYVVAHRRGQILNEKDMEYYKENGTWPKQNTGKVECRGLIPRARCATSGKTIQELIELYGLDFWDKKQFDKDSEYRVPAQAFAIGTNTFRMRHKCVVNIPSRGLYGKEMRQLFIASKGYKVLGCDGAGLELRMLSHFMGDEEYEKIILDGDIHTHNQNLGGLPKRDMAKTFIYAFLYGSGILGLALGCGLDEKAMRKVVAKFLKELPKLDDLIQGVQNAALTKGYMKAVDGRLGRVRRSGGEVKTHTALNVLLQMTGSLCMKWGLYFALEMFQKAGIDARLVANVHDEIQMEVAESEVEVKEYSIEKDAWKSEEKKVLLHKSGEYYSAPSIIRETKKGKFKIRRTYHRAGHLLCKAMEDAGKYLHIKTPLAGEYKTGNSWAETH
jgi:DNA polymerase I-like protein with 3'-5' exonuclease and polymerase domains